MRSQNSQSCTLTECHLNDSTFFTYSGTFLINDVKPTSTGEPSKIKVKVRLDIHGLFNVSSAQMIEKLPTPPPTPEKEQDTKEAEPEPMDTTPGANEEEKTNVNGETEKTENNEEQVGFLEYTGFPKKKINKFEKE